MKHQKLIIALVLAALIALAAIGLYLGKKSDGLLYFMTEQGLAVTEEGSAFYEIVAPGGLQSPCIVVDGQVYFGGEQSKGLYTLSAEGSPVLLSERLGWMPPQRMVAADGYLFFGGCEEEDQKMRHRYVYRLNTRDNTTERFAPVNWGRSYGLVGGDVLVFYQDKLYRYALDGTLLDITDPPGDAVECMDGALWRMGAHEAHAYRPLPGGRWDNTTYTAESLGIEGFWPREVKDGYLMFFTEGTDIGWVSGSLGLLSLADGSVRTYGSFPAELVWQTVTDRYLYATDGETNYRIELRTGQIIALAEREPEN